MDILSILDSKGIEYIPKNNSEYSIVCPNAVNHGGAVDAAPSFNINIDKIAGNCFSCGFSMSTATLTKWLLGESLDDLTYKCLELQGKLKKLSETVDISLPIPVSSDIIFPPGKPVSEPYRGISVETYRKLKAIICDRGRYENRICFPIVIHDRLVGVDARALSDDMQPKYLRNKGCTCSHDWLYPYDVVKEMKKDYVILAEGIFHSVNAVNFGFPCLCYFGVNNFSQNKAIMLLELGVQEVIIFPDKDEAGTKATTEIGNMLKDWFQVSVACTDNLKIDAMASLKKGSLVYQDLADLSGEEIKWSIDNRRSFNGMLRYS